MVGGQRQPTQYQESGLNPTRLKVDSFFHPFFQSPLGNCYVPVPLAASVRQVT